ncbi:MAG: hypothetical protein U0002_18465 [Thermoanaerobaculia bacterium]
MRRRSLLLPAAVLALLGAALGHQLLRRWGPSSPTTGRACWIWSPDSSRSTAPRTFWLVRDFSLPEAPKEASLEVLGDEEYVLSLNGYRLGANRYTTAAPLDRYEVGHLLQAGSNRIVAEVRSSRGNGGFLADLRVEGREVVVSDGSWRVIRAFDPWLARGWPLSGEAEAARVWGRSPIGRWRTPEQPEAPRPVFPPPGGPLHDTPALVSFLWSPEHGTMAVAGKAGRGRLFDWGREVSGYLSLALPSGTTEPGLIFVGQAPPSLAQAPADGFLLPLAGAKTWVDAEPRKFRYALVVAANPDFKASVWEVPAELVAELAPRPEPNPGTFGLRVPPRASPLETAIRQGPSPEPTPAPATHPSG